MRGGQQQESNKALDFYLVVALIAIALGLIWYFHHTWIVTFIFWARIHQGQALERALEFLQNLLLQFHLPVLPIDDFVMSMEYMKSADPAAVDIHELMDLSNMYGSLFMYFSGFFGCMLGGYMVFFHALSRYRGSYTMATLAKDESVNWPHITPVLDKNLIKEPLSSGPWAASMQPMEFCKKHRLIYPGRTTDGKSIAHLKSGEAFKVFCLQMGPYWNGLEGIPPYVMALFAIFAAKGCGDDKGAKKLMRQISYSSATGRLNFGGTRELLVQHVQSPKISRAVGPHAYLYTVMISMLELARRDGVLAVAEFLWLRPLDRQLWYVLSSVGRQTAFCEAAGPVAHYLVEKRLRRPLKVPMVQEAVNALSASLQDIIYREDD